MFFLQDLDYNVNDIQDKYAFASLCLLCDCTHAKQVHLTQPKREKNIILLCMGFLP